MGLSTQKSDCTGGEINNSICYDKVNATPHCFLVISFPASAQNSRFLDATQLPPLSLLCLSTSYIIVEVLPCS